MDDSFNNLIILVESQNVDNFIMNDIPKLVSACFRVFLSVVFAVRRRAIQAWSGVGCLTHRVVHPYTLQESFQYQLTKAQQL